MDIKGDAPIMIPCKIHSFEYGHDRKTIFYNLEPIVGEIFEFEVEYKSEANIAMTNKELIEVFMPIKDYWRCNIGDTFKFKFRKEPCRNIYDGKIVEGEWYLYFEEVK